MEAADVEELYIRTGFKYDLLGPTEPSRTLGEELCGQNQGLVSPSVHGSGILLPSPIPKGTGWGKALNKFSSPNTSRAPLSAKLGKWASRDGNPGPGLFVASPLLWLWVYSL